ncbi:hypothetical protein K1719_024120 [Acacia pycnantha]|nr:hypothetical protein K1719_024120 [Acacia pycnantha]
MKNPNYRTKFLLLSLGCGEAAVKNEYSAEDGDSWGALKYVFNLKTSASPLIDFMFDGNMDMSEYHLASLFQGLNDEDNYLRIQVLPLDFIKGNLLEGVCSLYYKSFASFKV